MGTRGKVRVYCLQGAESAYKQTDGSSQTHLPSLLYSEPPPEVLEVIRRKKALEEQAGKPPEDQVDIPEEVRVNHPDTVVQTTESVEQIEQKQQQLREQARREELEALRARLKKLEL